MIQLKRNHLIAAGYISLSMLIFSSCTSNWNWPQFRGSENNMVAKAVNLPEEWGEDLNIRWTTEMEGESWSSPVVWGSKIFVTSAVPVETTAPEQRDGDPTAGEEKPDLLNDVYRWQVSCLDLESGDILWNKVAYEGNPRIKKHRAHNYAAETPVTDGERLYAYFGMTGVYCYDLDGKLLWEKDLGAYNTLFDWGTGSSPVIYNKLLYIQVDNEDASFLVALDASSGDELWRVERDEKTNYSTPMIWKNSQRTELVTGGKTARSYDPATGKIFWELDMAGYYNIPSPVADKDYIYLGNTQWRDTPGTFFCVKAGAEGDITPTGEDSTSTGVVWSISDAPLANPSPLLYKGLLYLVSSRGGTVNCLDAATGELVYQEKLEGVGACWATPWAYGDLICFTDEKGTTQVFKAGESFELLGENTLDDKFWTSVAITKDAWLLKGAERMYCIGY